MKPEKLTEQVYENGGKLARRPAGRPAAAGAEVFTALAGRRSARAQTRGHRGHTRRHRRRDEAARGHVLHEIAADPESFEALAQAISIRRMREHGEGLTSYMPCVPHAPSGLK